ncbi:MAG: tyrosine-type recombinase/integrase [Thermoguttaceae bacterium]|jgi:integrase
MAKSTTKKSADKPAKPYPDFPLFAHATGRWAKKIRGKLHYFGPWDNWQDAFTLYQKQAGDLHAGRKPREDPEGITVEDLVSRFLVSKRHLVDTREIVERTLQDYEKTCERVVDVFGGNRLVCDIAPEDFECLRKQLARTRGLVALGNEVTRVRVLFKYAYDATLIDRPIRYGQAFRRPSRKSLRRARFARAPRMFQADEVKSLLAAAGLHMKAMILLGINCGFGPSDCGTLPTKSVDLVAGWVNYPRPKTGVPRRIPLWPETVAAIKESLAKRPKPIDEEDAGLVFVTKYGQRWRKDTSDNTLSKAFGKLIRSTKVKRGREHQAIYRKGLGFYGLRHTFQTIGDAARDPIATRAIMGHAEAGDDMSAVYREGVDDGRLTAVTDHVHQWLFGTDEAKAQPEPVEKRPTK